MSVFQQLNSLQTGSQFSRNLQTAAGNLRAPLSNFEAPVEAGEDAIEGAESAGMAAAPELAIIQIAQQAGRGLNSIMGTIMNNNISTNYQTSISTGHGIGLVESAQNQATSGYAQSSLEDIGGKLGAMFGGPLGALAGRGIAGLFAPPITGAIANSPTGRFDPQSGTTPQSQSSRNDTQQQANTLTSKLLSPPQQGYSDQQAMKLGMIQSNATNPSSYNNLQAMKLGTIQSNNTQIMASAQGQFNPNSHMSVSAPSNVDNIGAREMTTHATGLETGTEMSTFSSSSPETPSSGLPLSDPTQESSSQ